MAFDRLHITRTIGALLAIALLAAAGCVDCAYAQEAGPEGTSVYVSLPETGSAGEPEASGTPGADGEGSPDGKGIYGQRAMAEGLPLTGDRGALAIALVGVAFLLSGAFGFVAANRAHPDRRSVD